MNYKIGLLFSVEDPVPQSIIKKGWDRFSTGAHNSLNDVMCYVTSGKGLTPMVSM